VISCFPQRWDTWSTDRSTGPPPSYPPRPQPVANFQYPVADLNTGRELGPGPPPPPPQNLRNNPRMAPPPPPLNWPGDPPTRIKQTEPPKPAARPLNPPPDTGQPAPSHLSSSNMHGETNMITNPDELKNKNKAIINPSGILTWMAGGKKTKGRKSPIGPIFPTGEVKDSRPTSSIEQEERRRRRVFLQLDPLNVHQTILKHLQGTTRAPITSAYDLAKLITNSCANVFDQYRTPPDFQFFDFFERSIGALVSQAPVSSKSEVE
jgi:hypothetical protein